MTQIEVCVLFYCWDIKGFWGISSTQIYYSYLLVCLLIFSLGSFHYQVHVCINNFILSGYHLRHGYCSNFSPSIDCSSNITARDSCYPVEEQISIPNINSLNYVNSDNSTTVICERFQHVLTLHCCIQQMKVKIILCKLWLRLIAIKSCHYGLLVVWSEELL